jgi:glycosyltransferase involved in cell wall biosynthesis
MRIVHIQTGLPSSGNVPFKIHQSMLLSGIDSKFVVFDSQIPKNESISIMPSLKKKIYARIYNNYHKRLSSNIKNGSYRFSNPVTCGFDISNHPKIITCDFIYLHWSIGGFLSLKSIEKLIKVGKPVIVFLHDMWPITGGCHHSFECDNYSTGCKICPLFINEKSKIAQKQLKFKKELSEKYPNVYFQSPSSWMTECAKKSLATINSRIFQIPHLIDTSIFKKNDKLFARKVFDLPINKKIIGFGAIGGLKNKFKGSDYIEQSLKILSKRYDKSEISFVIFGTNELNQHPFLGFDTYNIGRLNDYRLLSLAYNTMDVFVTPSLAESFGMTALESIACGTPVVCFDVGGLKDVVVHKRNGYRALLKDANDLVNGIDYCLNNKLTFSLDQTFKIDFNIEFHKKMMNDIIIDLSK